MKKAIIYIVIGITCVALLYAIPDLYDIPIFTLSVILWVLFSIVLYITEKFYGRYNSVDELEYAISRKLNSEGFKCCKEEGRFVFQMDGRTFRTYFWNLGDGMFRTEFLDFTQMDDDWDAISQEGKAILADYINYDSPRVKFVYNEDVVVCQYITCVRNPKEFMKEADTAWRLTRETLKTIEEVLPKMTQRYAASGPIGFVKRPNGEQQADETAARIKSRME